MPAFDTRTRVGFRRTPLTLLVIVFLAAGAFIWYSLVTHRAIQAHVAVLDTRGPLNVLVGVQGTPLNPGFIGFVAEVRPHTQVLQVIPVSGRTPVTYNGTREDLSTAVSDVKPKLAMKLTATAAGVPIDHYFFLNQDDVIKLDNALYYHSPHWPKRDTPLTMLTTLGYPNGRIQPRQEMTLLRQMVNHLPTISPIAAGSLLSIPRTALTNLSEEQLYLLANYVRGDEVRLGSVPKHRTGRAHG